MALCVPPIYVQTSSRSDAEELAWSLLADDVRLVRSADDRWGVWLVAADAAATVETVSRCVERLRLGPVSFAAIADGVAAVA